MVKVREATVCSICEKTNWFCICVCLQACAGNQVMDMMHLDVWSIGHCKFRTRNMATAWNLLKVTIVADCMYAIEGWQIKWNYSAVLRMDNRTVLAAEQLLLAQALKGTNVVEDNWT